MEITRRHKTLIRRWFYPMRLQFRKDGCVYGQRRPGTAYGLLYTSQDLEKHIQTTFEAKDANN